MEDVDRCRSNTYHGLMPSIVFLCNNDRINIELSIDNGK